MHGEQCSGISAYAHKARMAKHKLPQKSGYQIQADRQDDIDADEHQNAGIVRIDDSRRYGSHDRGK